MSDDRDMYHAWHRAMSLMPSGWTMTLAGSKTDTGNAYIAQACGDDSGEMVQGEPSWAPSYALDHLAGALAAKLREVGR
jgi:hypothetical protein